MFNRALLVGRLCADPELKQTPNGTAVATVRLAVDRPFKNANGERDTDFIDVVAWRQQAEFLHQYVGKGRLLLVEGRLQVRQWQTQDGQKREKMEVVADNVTPLDKPKEQASGGQTQTSEAPPDDIYDPFADQ